jgi:AmmeMemoRadiSam system protein B
MGTAAGKANNNNNNNNNNMSEGTSTGSSVSVSGYSRRAHHAGSWYSSDPVELDATLTKYLQNVTTTTNGDDNNNNNNDTTTTSPQQPLRGIICPHAGFSYSGPTAAYSYWHLQHQIQTVVDSPIRHILVLHPSHHVYLDGCAVSGASVLETPVGNLTVDDELRREILNLKGGSTSVGVMRQGVDEREHSGEMQYPYIAKALKGKNNDQIKVLPIMCGNISTAQEEEFGKLLAPIVARPEVLCVISTDFCHWGKRFQYQPTPAPSTTDSKQIHEHIRELDHRGMNYIELQQPGAFAKYLKETQNTICGRHAIGVWLNAVHANNPNTEVLEIQFVKYAQSSQVQSMRESSVSYASATARQKK